MAAANGQKRFFLPENLVNEEKFAEIASPSIGRDMNGATHASAKFTVAINSRINILAARQKHSLATTYGFSNQFARSRSRERQGNRAGAHQGLLVRFGKAGGHIAELIAFFFDIWRNQDYRRLFYRRKLTFHSMELSGNRSRLSHRGANCRKCLRQC